MHPGLCRPRTLRAPNKDSSTEFAIPFAAIVAGISSTAVSQHNLEADLATASASSSSYNAITRANNTAMLANSTAESAILGNDYGNINPSSKSRVSGSEVSEGLENSELGSSCLQALSAFHQLVAFRFSKEESENLDVCNLVNPRVKRRATRCGSRLSK